MSTEDPIRPVSRPRATSLSGTVAYVVRRIGSFVLTTLLVAYFLFCFAFLGLRYLVLPNIDHYKPDIEKFASRAIGIRVGIGEIDASWRGLNPQLLLRDVAIYGSDGAPALALPEIDAGISWLSLPIMNLRLDWLHINRPDLHIRREASGRLSVAGIHLDTGKPSDGKGADWVLSQNEIVIRGGKLRWIDEQRNAPELTLTDVDLRLRNQWTYHRFALRAAPPVAHAAPLDLRAYFTHALFGKNISDPSGWKGQLYADTRRADLAAWNTYVDYPIALTRGTGALRAWLDFDKASITDLTADVSLTDVAVRLKKSLPKLELAQVDGRISASETANGGGTFSFGEQGHQVALTDFSLRTQAGLALPTTTITERFVPANGQAPSLTEITAAALDLHALTDLAAHLPLPPALRQKISDAAPRGRIRDVVLRWQGNFDDNAPRAYRVKGIFEQLALRPLPGDGKSGPSPVPGVENLNGSIDASEEGGSLTLKSPKSVLHLPALLRDPAVAFDELALRARWQFPNADDVSVLIDELAIRQSGPDGKVAGSVSGRLQMPLQQRSGKSPGNIELKGNFGEIDLRRIARYWPRQLPDDIHAWLAGALREGVGRDVTLAVKGDLADFPFRTTKPAEKPKGVFFVDGKIDRGVLNYAPDELSEDGASQLWPSIERIKARLVIDRTRLEIRAESGLTRKVSLSGVQATIPDFLAGANTMLLINGTGAGALQEMLDFVGQSPVAGWIDNVLEETRASGAAKLGLKLQMPLDRLRESKVDGTLQLADNDVTLMTMLPPLMQANGKLSFNEKGFQLIGIDAEFLGGRATISGGSTDNGQVLVRAEGNITVDGARAYYTAPAMQRLLARFSGGSQYSTSIAVRNGRPEIEIESDLEGIGLDFPSPLKKAAGTAMPLSLRLTGQPSDDPTLARDTIRLSLGKTIEAQYQREKRIGKEDGKDDKAGQQRGKPEPEWRVTAGGIGVNVPAPQPDGGLTANVSIAMLNVDDWRGTVAAISGDAGTSSPGPIDGKRASGSPEQEGGLTQYIDPEVVAAQADTLVITGKKLQNVIVGASHRNGVWQANIDSRQASGHVTWNAGVGLGRLTARLSSLIIPESAATDVGDLLDVKDEETRIPALDIVADDFQLFGKQFGRLELGAVNVRTERGREWRINRLAVVNPDAAFNASGSWVAGAKDSTSKLAYVLDVANAGQLLERFGFADVLRGGKGRLDGELSWSGLPFSLDIPSLSGQMRLDMQAGQFLKVDPGAAKLLGVLSLQSLPRRLSLDFRDVFSEGYAFDGVVGTATIRQGKLTTDNFKMRSINATVLMDGTADIAAETQNLHVAVIPKINAGAASIVYGLAINPVIGVGTFLAQLFLSDPLSRAFTFEYRITGPWAEPVVTKLDRRTGKSAEDAPDDPMNNQAG